MWSVHNNRNLFDNYHLKKKNHGNEAKLKQSNTEFTPNNKLVVKLISRVREKSAVNKKFYFVSIIRTFFLHSASKCKERNLISSHEIRTHSKIKLFSQNERL